MHGIQKIKPININKDNTINNKNKNENVKEENKKTLSKSDIQNVKKFLIEEYGVSEKCLEIN